MTTTRNPISPALSIEEHDILFEYVDGQLADDRTGNGDIFTWRLSDIMNWLSDNEHDYRNVINEHRYEADADAQVDTPALDDPWWTDR
jgi:hypothetical protein